MNIKRTWLSKESTVDEDFISLCSFDRVFAVLLKNRGVDTKEKILAFLNPLKQKLIRPDAFSDMNKAAERIKKAIDTGEIITVYGDFDADGISSASILYLTLKKIGAQVNYYLPDRANESHGLNTKALVNIISKSKSKLIITVDCGISNVQEIKFAKGFKVDVIITDHHEAPEILPEAFAILNPKAPDSLEQNLSSQDLKSLTSLAGVGVAFKLCCKLLEMYNYQDFVHEILPLVAVGTVGDVVELLDENRSLVAMGLELIKNGKHKGIQKILDSMAIEDKSVITAENIAFGVVPRINAAGRLDSPLKALTVLISSDEKEIDENIKTLNSLNVLRQQLCDETFLQAVSMYESKKTSHKKSIVLLNENWNVGIIGIVASKLAETYNKPVFLMTRDAKENNIIRCSCRSIDKINIFELLSLFKDLFIAFGGHKMAAGFSFDENKTKFEEFKTLLNNAIDENTRNIDFSQVNVFADMIVTPDEITEKTIDNINKMQPFGAGNEAPTFIMQNLVLKQYKMMGQANNHLKILAEKDGVVIECVKWNMPNFHLNTESNFDILFFPQINEFNGNKKIQYLLSDIHSEAFENCGKKSDIRILDHRSKQDILNQVLDFVNSTKKKTCIYVENPKIKKQIESNNKVIQCCFGTDNIPSNYEQLMFFDSPSNKEDFINIVKTTGADIVHLMNFGIDSLTADNLVLILSGMLKYSLNNLNGKLNIEKMAKSSGTDVDIVINTILMFNEVNMVDAEQISENEYRISSLNPVEISKIKNSSLYSVIEDEISEINNFKNFYLNAKVEDIKELLL